MSEVTDKAVFIYMIIEAIVFLIPVATVFIRVGGLKQMLQKHDEELREFPEWKASTSTKIEQLELNDITQNNTLIEINKNIAAISAKMDLLLNDRIKLSN